MGTVISTQAAGEPLLATGTQGTTDYTFRQLRALTQLVSSGVMSAADLKVSTDGSGMDVQVASGYAWVPGSSILGPSGQHKYGVPVDAAKTLSGITAPASATRRDLVVLRVYDEGDSAGPGRPAESELQYIKNATESLTPESLPLNSLLLAYVDVPVGATSITSSMITDKRSVVSGPVTTQHLYIPTEETLTSTTPVALATSDSIALSVAAESLLRIYYEAEMKNDTDGATVKAYLVVGGNTIPLDQAPLITISDSAPTNFKIGYSNGPVALSDTAPRGSDLSIDSYNARSLYPWEVKVTPDATSVAVQFAVSAGTGRVRNRRLYVQTTPLWGP